MISFIEYFLGRSIKWLLLFIIGSILNYFILKIADKKLPRKIYNIIHFITYAILGIFLILFIIELIVRVFTI